MTVFEKIWFAYTFITWGWFFLGCIIDGWLCFFADIKLKTFEVFQKLTCIPLMTWITLEAFYFILKLILCGFGINFDLFPSI